MALKPLFFSGYFTTYVCVWGVLGLYAPDSCISFLLTENDSSAIIEQSNIKRMLMMNHVRGRTKYHRHERQAIIPEIGFRGQRRLQESSILVVGAGGLGSPALLYLCAAGVGTIGIVDGDVVEESNLQRQVIHSTANIGRPKTTSAKETLHRLDPDICIHEYPIFLTSDNAEEIVEKYDVVINGSDNFGTRYLVNDICVKLKKPLVDASITKFQGQGAVFLPDSGCYRCLFPSSPPEGVVPSCSESGILGAVAGFMGTWQAAEGIKILLGIGSPSVGKLTMFNLLSGVFKTVKWKKSETCPTCGAVPSGDDLLEQDYDIDACAIPDRREKQEESVVLIGPEVLQKWQNLGTSPPLLIDICEPLLRAESFLPHAECVSTSDLDSYIKSVDPSTPNILDYITTSYADTTAMLELGGHN